jgi:hypothetical protein
METARRFVKAGLIYALHALNIKAPVGLLLLLLLWLRLMQHSLSFNTPATSAKDQAERQEREEKRQIHAKHNL